MFEAWRRFKQLFLSSDKVGTLARGSASTVGIRLISNVLSFVTALVLARLLGASHYGMYIYAFTWFAFLLVPTALGMDIALVRFVAAYREKQHWSELKGLLRFGNGLSFVASVFVAGCAVLAMTIFVGQDSAMRWTLLIMFACLPLSVSILVGQAILRGLQRVVLAQIPDAIVQPTFLFALAVIGYVFIGKPSTAPEVAVLTACAIMAAFLTLTLLRFRCAPAELRDCSPSYQPKVWLGAFLPLVIIGVVQFLQNRVDILMLGVMAGTQEVGIYGVAKRGAELVLFILDATSLAGAPLIASLYAAGDRAELQRVVSLTAQANFFLSAPICLLLFAGAPWFMGLFGNEFASGTNTLRVLAVFQLASASTGAVGQILYMTGYQKEVAWVMVITAGLGVSLNVILIPFFGMVGAAVATGVSVLAFKGILVGMIYSKLGVLATVSDFRRFIPATKMSQGAPGRLH